MVAPQRGHAHARSNSVPLVAPPVAATFWKSPFKRLRPSSIVATPASHLSVRGPSPVKASSPIKLSNPFPFFRSKPNSDAAHPERTAATGGTLRRTDKVSATGLSILSAQLNEQSANFLHVKIPTPSDSWAPETTRPRATRSMSAGNLLQPSITPTKQSRASHTGVGDTRGAGKRDDADQDDLNLSSVSGDFLKEAGKSEGDTPVTKPLKKRPVHQRPTQFPYQISPSKTSPQLTLSIRPGSVASAAYTPPPALKSSPLLTSPSKRSAAQHTKSDSAASNRPISPYSMCTSESIVSLSAFPSPPLSESEFDSPTSSTGSILPARPRNSPPLMERRAHVVEPLILRPMSSFSDDESSDLSSGSILVDLARRPISAVTERAIGKDGLAILSMGHLVDQGRYDRNSRGIISTPNRSPVPDSPSKRIPFGGNIARRSIPSYDQSALNSPSFSCSTTSTTSTSTFDDLSSPTMSHPSSSSQPSSLFTASYSSHASSISSADSRHVISKSGKILRSQTSPFVKLDGIGFGSTVFASHPLDHSLEVDPSKIHFTREIEIYSESDADEEEEDEDDRGGYYDVMTSSSPDNSSTSELSCISEGEEDVTIQCGAGGRSIEVEVEKGREMVLIEYGVAY